MSVNAYPSSTEALADLARRGFTANFEFLDGALTDVDSGRTFGAPELTIVEHHRFEGASDPDDMEIVYAIESRDGTRGVLVDAFGTYSNPELSRFIEQVAIHETV
jgi:hypothetical protein